MRKLLVYSVLSVAAWLGLTTAWVVTSHATGLPGPSRVATASIDLSAELVESVDFPRPLSDAQRAVTRQMRRSGRVIRRVYRVPERLAGRLLHELGRRLEERLRQEATLDGLTIRVAP